MKAHSIPSPELSLLLKPTEEPTRNPSYEVDLSLVFRDILVRANDFVPSDAGSIFLEDSTYEDSERPVRELVLVTSYGADAEVLVGRRLHHDDGIAGLVYQSGQAYIGSTPSTDYLRDTLRHQDHSVVAVPLHLGAAVVGVLELVNDRVDAFATRQLELLEIFAQTISVSLANAAEAQRSKEMARRDDLTRLYNDRFLHHSLTQVLAQSLNDDGDCGLIFFDLDYFKSINDHHGHLAGSRVLSEIGNLLRQVLPGPAVPARYGGDEFVIILPEHTKQEVHWVAETIRKTIETHVFLAKADGDDPVNYPALEISAVTCSVGLATLREDILPRLGDEQRLNPVTVKNEILRVADGRMYYAKEHGRNQSVMSDLAAVEVGPGGAVGTRSRKSRYGA